MKYKTLILISFVVAGLLAPIAVSADTTPGLDSIGQSLIQSLGSNIGPSGNINGGSGTFVPLAPIPGLTGAQGVVTSGSLASFLSNLYIFIIGIAAILAVIYIVWGGLLIMGQESVTKHGEGRQKIQEALLGLALVLAPVLVFTIINPAILNLNLSLQPLNVNQYQPPAGGPSSGPTTDPGLTGIGAVAGCSISGTYVQKATCGTDAAFSSWTQTCSSSGGQVTGAQSSEFNCKVTNGQRTCDQQTTSYCQHSISGNFILQNLGSASIGTNYDLHPVSDPNNPMVSSDGQKALSFVNSCKSEGGVACTNGGFSMFSSHACPSYVNSTLTDGQSGRCYSFSALTCEPPISSSGTGFDTCPF